MKIESHCTPFWNVVQAVKNSSSSIGSTALSQALASSTIFFHLSLSNANPTGRRWKFNPAEFLEASQHFRFYRVELLAPRPTPTMEDQASVFISPRGRVAQLYPPGKGYPF
jgi:hypothetical protein